MPGYDNARFCAVEDTMGVGEMCKWPNPSVTWGIADVLPGFTFESFKAAIELAWSEWVRVCGIRPQFITNSNPNISIGLQTLTPYGVLADMQLPCGLASNVGQTRFMRIDTTENWVVAENPPGNAIDLVRVVRHELGHAIGIPHIGMGNLMAPTYSSTLSKVQSGDIVEAFARYPVVSTPPPPTGNYTLSISPTTVAPGQTVVVSFTSAVAGAQDWIGLYKPGTPNTSQITYKYTGGAISGGVSFSIAAPGEYEFRYFVNNQYDLKAVSGKLTVGSTPTPGDPDQNVGSIVVGGATYDLFARKRITVITDIPIDSKLGVRK